MRLLVVGPDKAGKSTLVRGLQEVFQLEHRKATRIPDRDERLRQTLQWWLCDLPSHVIMDREAFPDDLIYEPTIEGQSSPLEAVAPLLIRQMIKQKVLTLYVHAAPQVIADRYQKEGGDSYVPIEKIPDIIRGYERFFRSASVPMVEIDTSFMSQGHCLIKASSTISTWYSIDYITRGEKQ